MSKRPCIRLALAGVVVLFGPTLSPAASEEQPLRWRMTSLLHPRLFGEAGEMFAATVRRLSRGGFEIEAHDRLVLDQDVFEALRSGLIDAAWGSAGHHHREDPALTLFSGFPFGPDPELFTAWMLQGGGAEALGEIYARHGLKSLYCGALPAEGGGWFRKPVGEVADLDGLSMRSFGYAALTLRKLGVTTYELPADEIAPAFEAGLIDAAEFSLPSIDAELGIAEVAKHLYFPGWQQPATSLEILMTERGWAALSDNRKAMLEAACGAVMSTTTSGAAMRQIEALAGFRAAGVAFHQWPTNLLSALRQAWGDVIAEEAARDPLLASAWRGWLDFRDDYAGWRSRTRIDGTGSAGQAGEP